MKKNYFLIIALFLSAVGTIKAQYTNLLNFNGTNGANPSQYGGLILSGSKLYGMSELGGKHDSGCIYSIDTNGSNYTDLFDFKGATGYSPEGSLTLSGGKLFGMVSLGGAHKYGCIFSIDTDGSDYKILLSFNDTTGGYPYGSLFISGNKLYGMSEFGGKKGDGCIFSIDTSGNRYIDLHDFDTAIGAYSPVLLTMSAAGMLYGIMPASGFYSSGSIFAMDTNGSRFMYLYIFNDTTGAWPVSGLVLSGSELFGMAEYGGTYTAGTIFALDTNGNNFRDLVVFNGINGQNPTGLLTLSGNKLYGMTMNGGTGSFGNIFSIDTNGGAFTNMYDFNDSTGDDPKGSLTVSGNVLYGTTPVSGTNNDGVIFKIDTSTVEAINNLALKQGSINVYPNPNTGEFTIKGSVVGGQSSVDIYNILGEKVYSQLTICNSQYTINLGAQPSGVYFYRVLQQGGGLVGSGKIVIEK